MGLFVGGEGLCDYAVGWLHSYVRAGGGGGVGRGDGCGMPGGRGVCAVICWPFFVSTWVPS